MWQQWNSVGGAVWLNRETVFVEQWNRDSGTVMVEQCGGMVEECWWNSVVEEWNSVGGTVWRNSVVEQWNSVGGTVKQ